jgi:hypothetical protein
MPRPRAVRRRVVNQRVTGGIQSEGIEAGGILVVGIATQPSILIAKDPNSPVAPPRDADRLATAGTMEAATSR